MVARNPSQSNRKPLTNYRAAKLLDVSLSHLGRVLAGKRTSRRLAARYAELVAKLEAQH